MALDFFLGGSGAGLLGIYSMMALAGGLPTGISVDYVLVGVALAVAGLLLLISELGRPSRFWRSVTNWKTSWMARGSAFNLALMLCSLGLYLASVAVRTMLLPLIQITLVSSLLVMAYPGFLLHDVHDIGLWVSPLLPMLMFLYSLLSGVSAFVLLTALLGESLSSVPWVGASIMVTLDVLLLAFLRAIRTSHSQSVLTSYYTLSKGRMAAPFVIGVMILGTTVPTACFLFQALYAATLVDNMIVMEIGALAFLLGAFLFRYCLLKAAFHEPLKVMAE